MKFRVGFGAVAAACLVLAACGGGDDSGGGGGGGGSSTTSGGTGGAGQGVEISGAKTIDPNSMNNAPKGTIRYCQGKDTNGSAHEVVKLFNQKFGGQGYNVKLVEFPASADQQRTLFIQRQQAKSDDCDVFSSDVIWTAEFAPQKWLYDMTPYVQKAKSRFIQAPLETVHYANKYWGIPSSSDAAFLYYRNDKIKNPPATWQQVYQQAAQQGGIVYQGAPYEGLTCDFLEIAFAAGGKVLSDDGSKSEINSPQNIKALQFMIDGIKNGAAPKAVTTYMEPETDQSWASGKYAFMRNWPGSYGLAQQSGSKSKGKTAVAPLPAFEGGGKAGILGGHNSVISVYTKNAGLSLKFADFLASDEWQKILLGKYTLTAVTNKAYDDPTVKKNVPFAAQLKQAIAQAKPRPVSPVYPQISQAIYKNVNDALAGRTSAQDALKKADSQISSALQTF
jgi:trehalose/maltose transport system substrate-binding protein